jgi:integrase
VEKIHAILHRALEMAVKWDYVPRNVADAVDKPTVPKHDIRPPDPTELTRLVDSARQTNDRHAPLWILAIYTGCPQGELLGLGWSDLDLDAATLTVRRGLTGVKNHIPGSVNPSPRPAAAPSACRLRLWPFYARTRAVRPRNS